MTYLLDTNVWVGFLRNRNARLAQRLRAHDPSDVCVCSVVVAELYHGCLRSNQPVANRAKVESLLAPYVCLPFDEASAAVYSVVRHALEQAGAVIGPYDLQIASIAIANGLTLVSHNVAEFGRIAGLTLEDWE